MSEDLKTKIEETEEDIQKAKYLKRKTMLIISIVALMGLLIIFGDVSRRFSKIEDNDYSVYKIRENVLYIFEGRSDPKVEYEVEDLDASGSFGGSGGSHHEQHIDYNIALSDSDPASEDITAFLFPDTSGIAMPGISQVNNYSVNVNCSADADLKFALVSFSGRDDILDVLYAEITVGESEIIFNDKFRALRDSFAHYPVSGNTENNLIYKVKVYVPADVMDDFSKSGDGDYQGEMVNFSLKWWI